MPPPIMIMSAVSARLSMMRILSDTFAPPMTIANGRLGQLVTLSRASISFCINSPTAEGRKTGHASGRSVLAVSHAETVVYIDVSKSGEIPGEFGVIGLLSGVKANVFQHHNAAWTHTPDGAGQLFVDAAFPQIDLTPDHLGEAVGDWGHGEGFRPVSRGGRPLCEQTMTRQPRSSRNSIVGNDSEIRISSDIRPVSSVNGTL